MALLESSTEDHQERGQRQLRLRTTSYLEHHQMKLGHSSDWLAIAEGCSSPSAEEGREDLVSFTVACELINHASFLLEACEFVLTPRRAPIC